MKLRFSEDECDDDLPVHVVLEGKRRRTAVGSIIGGAGQPETSSDEEEEEGDSGSCSSETSDDCTDDSDDSTDNSEEDETVEIIDDEPGQEVVQQVPDPGQGTSSGSGVDRDDPVSVTLTDPEVLDCSICLEPLSAPVFQVCQYFSSYRALEFYCVVSVFRQIFVFGRVGICGLINLV